MPVSLRSVSLERFRTRERWRAVGGGGLPACLEVIFSIFSRSFPNVFLIFLQNRIRKSSLSTSFSLSLSLYSTFAGVVLEGGDGRGAPLPFASPSLFSSSSAATPLASSSSSVSSTKAARAAAAVGASSSSAGASSAAVAETTGAGEPAAAVGRGRGELPRLLLLLFEAAAAAAETAEGPRPAADHDGGHADTGLVPKSGLAPPAVPPPGDEDEGEPPRGRLLATGIGAGTAEAAAADEEEETDD